MNHRATASDPKAEREIVYESYWLLIKPVHAWISDNSCWRQKELICYSLVSMESVQWEKNRLSCFVFSYWLLYFIIYLNDPLYSAKCYRGRQHSHESLYLVWLQSLSGVHKLPKNYSEGQLTSGQVLEGTVAPLVECAAATWKKKKPLIKHYITLFTGKCILEMSGFG